MVGKMRCVLRKTEKGKTRASSEGARRKKDTPIRAKEKDTEWKMENKPQGLAALRAVPGKPWGGGIGPRKETHLLRGTFAKPLTPKYIDSQQSQIEVGSKGVWKGDAARGSRCTANTPIGFTVASL